MFRRLVGIVIAGLVLAAAAAGAGTMVSYPSGSDTVSGYLAAPGGQGKKPAIVVIHEWYGLNDFAKAKAEAFAKQGYVALAVDLYRGKVADNPDTAHQLMRGMPEDRAVRDLKAAVAYLRSRPDVEGAKIASIGWCMGGGYALAAALAEPTLAGTVIYYGHLVTDPKTIAGLNVPLLGNFGGKDQGIPPADVKAFEEAAKKAGARVDFKIYPDAGHAFASSKDPAVYRPDDAKDADARTDAFLAKVLSRPPKADPRQ
jgi:carboxymethylenebutenolidase